jgi:hypothetical protein
MSVAILGRSDWLGYEDYEPVSDFSRAIERMAAQRKNYREGTSLDWFPIIEAALLNIRDECTQPNWDGDGAIPVGERTINLAGKVTECLFSMLPKGTPAPDLIPEFDGDISISWSVDTNRIFSISVGAHGKINFAGQFGVEGAQHGWQPVDATSRRALEASLQDIARLVAKLHSTTTVRRAA